MYGVVFWSVGMGKKSGLVEFLFFNVREKIVTKSDLCRYYLKS